MKKVLLATSIIVIATYLPLSATIINVPADQPIIQAGIISSADGDTVLVQPGTYVENINFNGHSIVLASLFLTTEDTSYIATTIIDGDSSGSVITLNSGETDQTVIVGFTIQNGYSGLGGGVQCTESDLTIKNNIIVGNKALYGGGIECDISSPNSLKIVNNTISYNVAVYDGGALCNTSGAITVHSNFIIGNICQSVGGGGICCCGDTITNNIIINNSSVGEGGGIWCGGVSIIKHNLIIGNSAYSGAGIFVGSSVSEQQAQLINNTIVGNTSTTYGGAITFYGISCFATCKNNICWGNGPVEISLLYNAAPLITYCDIQGGYDGEGNINCIPRFCGTNFGNYQLIDNSCCLGSGEGGADIGAYGVGCYGLEYLAGDANMTMGVWPPTAIGADVTYLVNYFRSFPGIQACLLDGFWAAADMNGDCNVIGSDVTYRINVARGIGSIQYCPDYPPAWLTPLDLPAEAPPGWPGCE